MERETRKFKTIGGFEIEVKTFLTGGEARELRDVILAHTEIKAGLDAKDVDIGAIRGTYIKEMEDKQIEIIVISVNGIKENILKNVLDLPSDDYNEVYAEIQKIQTSAQKTEKKN